jgi:hypothetical protein
MGEAKRRIENKDAAREAIERGAANMGRTLRSIGQAISAHDDSIGLPMMAPSVQNCSGVAVSMFASNFGSLTIVIPHQMMSTRFPA